jgi:hypothetical protein
VPEESTLFPGGAVEAGEVAATGRTVAEGEDTGDDGNKSLYLVFVGVVFLSILDCF